jgi:adenylyl-sulfate kinase
LRQSLCKDLGYSKEDRDINIERASILARYLSKHGVGVIASFISPYQKQRKLARVGIDNFIEVYVNSPLEVCKSRDTKGLYKKAIEKQINNFTGMDDPYEAPENPQIELKTDKYSIEECVDKIIVFLRERKLI